MYKYIGVGFSLWNAKKYNKPKVNEREILNIIRAFIHSYRRTLAHIQTHTQRHRRMDARVNHLRLKHIQWLYQANKYTWQNSFLSALSAFKTTFYSFPQMKFSSMQWDTIEKKQNFASSTFKLEIERNQINIKLLFKKRKKQNKTIGEVFCAKIKREKNQKENLRD